MRVHRGPWKDAGFRARGEGGEVAEKEDVAGGGSLLGEGGGGEVWEERVGEEGGVEEGGPHTSMM